VQWDPEKPLTISNITLMYGQIAKEHNKLKSYEEVRAKYPEEVHERREQLNQKLKTLMQKKPIVYK
jgi:hypothetical protein